MLTYQPILNDGVEQGIGTGGDRQYHYSLAQLTDQDLYPFSDWWSEFPPIWYLITTSVYQLMGENVNYSSWSLLLGMLMIVSEVGILVLMRNIGTAVAWGRNRHGIGMDICADVCAICLHVVEL